MSTSTISLVTIVAEGVLRERLLSELLELGARGYTVGEVEGHGTRGVSTFFWTGTQVRIEVLTSPEVADRILDHVQAEYFTHYSVIAYVSEVRVIRSEKYT